MSSSSSTTRKRRSSTRGRGGNNPVVAPGGGTQADVNHLSRQLGMRSDAVHAILNCQGAGVEAIRSRRSRGAGAADPTAPTAMTTSTAWADFMSEEGFGQATSNEAPTSTQRSKRSRKDTPDDTEISSTITNNAPVKRDYVLPIKPRMRLGQKSKTSSSSDDDDDGYVEAGILAQTGSLDGTMPGRSARPLTLENVDLKVPTLVMYESVFGKTKIALIATSSSACHSVAIDTTGQAFAWGRNENGQCGIGTLSDCVPYPTPIGADLQYVGAAVGKSHSLLIEHDTGIVYGAGSNKMGQCGVNHSMETVLNFKKCFLAGASDKNIVTPVQVSCGESFSVVLTDKGHLYTAGLAQFGQLGNGETGEYFIAANKIGFNNSSKFERRSVFVKSSQDDSNITDTKKELTPLEDSADIVIGSISCGKYHTIAVEAICSNKTSTTAPRVFSWGCGDYGCLGHNVQADEYTPRVIASLSGPLFQSNQPTSAAAGGTCSMILTKNGHVYYWGKHKTTGEAAMRPSLVEVMANNQHQVSTLSAGFSTVFLSTRNGVTVSWGNGPNGELGYGIEQKSSSKPKFVETLDKVLVTDVQCGYGHTLFLLRDRDQEDKSAIQRLPNVEIKDLTEFTKVLSSKKTATTTLVVTKSDSKEGKSKKPSASKPKNKK